MTKRDYFALLAIRSFSFPLFREGCGMLPLFYPPEGLRGLLGPNPVVLVGEGTP